MTSRQCFDFPVPSPSPIAGFEGFLRDENTSLPEAGGSPRSAIECQSIDTTRNVRDGEDEIGTSLQGGAPPLAVAPDQPPRSAMTPILRKQLHSGPMIPLHLATRLCDWRLRSVCVFSAPAPSPCRRPTVCSRHRSAPPGAMSPRQPQRRISTARDAIRDAAVASCSCPLSLSLLRLSSFDLPSPLLSLAPCLVSPPFTHSLSLSLPLLHASLTPRQRLAIALSAGSGLFESVRAILLHEFFGAFSSSTSTRLLVLRSWSF